MLNLNVKNPTHQRVASDFVNGSMTKSSSIENSQNKIEIDIHYKPKLEKLFLNDINPNITIICGSKKYPLNKAYLRVDSQFFSKKFDDDEELKEIVLDQSKFPEKYSDILEKILRCLYGGKSLISYNELYQTYRISRELKIDKLVNKLDQEILKNYQQFNFFTIFQLAVTYNDYDLLNKSKEYLDECSFDILKESQYLEKMNSPYPQTFVDLDLEAARTILNFNKETNYLQVGETFDIIREYANNNQNTADIVALVKEFLPQESLPAAQYKYIYSQLPLDESFQIQPKQSISIRIDIIKNHKQKHSTALYEINPTFVFYKKLNQNMILFHKKIKLKLEIYMAIQSIVGQQNQIVLSHREFIDEFKQTFSFQIKIFSFIYLINIYKKLTYSFYLQLYRNQGLQESNIIQYQLESENIYYQKKIKEMETQNHKLQDEMMKMKKEIEQKTDEFNKKEQTLILKLSNIENSVKQFEALDKGKEHEYNRKLQKLFKMIKEREAQLMEKERQYSDLYTVLKNFTFQQQQPVNSQVPQNNGLEQQQNQMKANTHQGFNRHSSLQNYPDNTLMENHKMKSSDSSLMMTQNSIMYVTGGMEQSQLVPLSDLESMNQSMQSNRMFKNKLNFNNNQSLYQPQKLTSNNESYIDNPNFMAPNIMNNYMKPISEKKESQIDPKPKGINNQELINSMEISQNEPNTNICDIINDEDTESAVMNNFLSFIDQSKVLEDCHLNYKSILSNLFDLSPFKKMSLKLLYRQSRDKLTKASFLSKVKNTPQTVVLIKSWEYDKLFGAYMSIPWSGEQGYQTDEEAFLFSISENRKIHVKNFDSAIFYGDDNIFSFGTNDLCIVEHGDTEEANKSDYPQDYEEIKQDKNIPLNCFLAGNQSFQVDELEVFKIIIEEDMDF